MLIYRSIWKVNKLFFDWDLIDKDVEYVIDNKLAIKHSKYYWIITKTILDEWEVHININDKDYVGYKLKTEYLWNIKDWELFSLTYEWDWYELWWWKLNVNVIWDYEERWDEIMKYAWESLIDDMTYVIYKNLFNKAIMKKVVYEFVDRKQWTYKFVDWIIVEIVGSKDSNVTKSWIIKDHKEYYQDILKSEWKQWYWNSKELLYNEWWQTVPVKLWHTQEIEIDWQPMKLYDMYTPQVRLAMLKWVYTDEQIEKAQNSWSLKTLQHWQYDVVKNFWHVNVVAAVRRAGKSFLSALLAVRELLRENYSPKPTRILYYGLSVWKTKTVIDYLLTLTKDFRKFKMFQRRQSERTLSFIDPDTKDTIWSIEFHSAQEDEAWVGEYADMIIIDEAARFPEYVYDAMKAIIFSEWAKAFIISTIWWDTSKNWFYQELLKAEKENIKRKWSIAEYEYVTDKIINKVNEHWHDYFLKNKAEIYDELNRAIFEYKRYVAWRVTIDEIDRMPDYKKKALINEIKDNPLRYFTEVYCIYPSENKVFNYESGLSTIDKDEVLNKRKYQKIYVWYDPALTSDNAGITSVWVYRDDLWKLKFEIFDSIFINPNRGMRYQEQVKYVTKIVQWYKQVCPDTYLCVDAWWVWIAVMENFKDQSVDFPIKSVGTWVLHRERWVWVVPKEFMVITLKNLFDEWYVKINKDLKDLLSEIDYFKKRVTSSGNNKYEAEVWHDDLVTSMMISIFSAYEIDALKNELDDSDEMHKSISWITFDQLSEMQKQEQAQNELEQSFRTSNEYMSKFWF